MSQIIKTFLSLFFLLFFVVTGVGCISAGADIEHAKAFKTDVVADLENSNYNADVMNACIQSASNNGYELNIVAYDKSGSTRTYQTGQLASDTQNIYAACVTLKYKYHIGLLNIHSDKEVRGMAR